MAIAIYILCTATSLLCSILLWRGYRRSGTRLLLWSCLCFLFLSMNNAMLFADRVLFPEIEMVIGDLSFAVLRSVTALAGLLLLVYGLIWDS
jgi:hypothetical protein